MGLLRLGGRERMVGVVRVVDVALVVMVAVADPVVVLVGSNQVEASLGMLGSCGLLLLLWMVLE